MKYYHIFVFLFLINITVKAAFTSQEVENCKNIVSERIAGLNADTKETARMAEWLKKNNDQLSLAIGSFESLMGTLFVNYNRLDSDFKNMWKELQDLSITKKTIKKTTWLSSAIELVTDHDYGWTESERDVAWCKVFKKYHLSCDSNWFNENTTEKDVRTIFMKLKFLAGGDKKNFSIEETADRILLTNRNSDLIYAVAKSDLVSGKKDKTFWLLSGYKRYGPDSSMPNPGMLIQEQQNDWQDLSRSYIPKEQLQKIPFENIC